MGSPQQCRHCMPSLAGVTTLERSRLLASRCGPCKTQQDPAVAKRLSADASCPAGTFSLPLMTVSRLRLAAGSDFWAL